MIVTRFESSLLRRNRIRVWRQVYCVLEKGILSFYNNRADALAGTRRRDYYYLESAIVEANNDNLSAFIIFLSLSLYVHLSFFFSPIFGCAIALARSRTTEWLLQKKRKKEELLHKSPDPALDEGC